jgi:hypothetical protein
MKEVCAAGRASTPNRPSSSAIVRAAKEKLRAADYEDLGLVFATRKGTPLDAQNVINRHFKPLLNRAGLPLSAGTIFVTRALLCFWGAASTRNSYSIFSGTPR